jgi:hypothetical protein
MPSSFVKVPAAFVGSNHLVTCSSPRPAIASSVCPVLRNIMGGLRCRSKPRSESGGGKLFRYSVPLGCRCRWRVVHQVIRQQTFRHRRSKRATKSFSLKRKSLTLAWRRSMYSTKRTSVLSDPVFSLSRVVAVEAAAVAEVAAAAALGAAEVAASGAVPAVSASGAAPGVLLSPVQAAADIGAAAVCRGEPVATVRRAPAVAS